MSTLQISGQRIEYLELGSGEPVVLLHSSGSSAAQWRALAERLAERYRVIAPDLYGYGGTAHWPGRRPFQLECEAEIGLAPSRRLALRSAAQPHVDRAGGISSAPRRGRPGARRDHRGRRERRARHY